MNTTGIGTLATKRKNPSVSNDGREIDVERQSGKLATRLDCKFVKNKAGDGIPDRLLLIPVHRRKTDIDSIWIEFKKPGEIIEAGTRQADWQDWLRRDGRLHWMVDDFAFFEAALSLYCEGVYQKEITK